MDKVGHPCSERAGHGRGKAPADVPTTVAKKSPERKSNSANWRKTHKKQLLCCAFEKGTCELGDSCEYSHNAADAQNAPRPEMACNFFRKFGSCRYGMSCKFSHDRAGPRTAEAAGQVRAKACFHFARTGTCRFGESCMLTHSSSNRNSTTTSTDSGNATSTSPVVARSLPKPAVRSLDPEVWLRSVERARRDFRGSGADTSLEQAERYLLLIQQVSQSGLLQLLASSERCGLILGAYVFAAEMCDKILLPLLFNQVMQTFAAPMLNTLPTHLANMTSKDKNHAIQLLVHLFTSSSAQRFQIVALLPFLKEQCGKEGSIGELLEQLGGLCQDFTAAEAKRALQGTESREKSELGFEQSEEFKHMSVLPLVKSFDAKYQPVIAKNQTERGYRSALHLLETQVRLMHEDLNRPLREGVQEFLAERHVPFRSGVEIYSKVSFWQVQVHRQEGLVIYVSFLPPGRIRWEHSKKLIYGSLVCLSDDNFKSEPLWATVAERELYQLNAKIPPRNIDTNQHNNKQLFIAPDNRPAIGLKIIKGDMQRVWDCLNESTTGFLLYESTSAFFLPYNAVITALQGLAKTTPDPPAELLPFVRQLVDLEPAVKLPSYLRPGREYKMPCFRNPNDTKEKISFDVTSAWPSHLETSLDSSQQAALRQILTKEVALVQGPPGTGKTHTALQALQVMLLNLPVGHTIFLLAYTNHALDQLVRGVLKFETSVIRVGGCSEDPDLEPYSLFRARSRGGSRHINQRQFELRQELAQATARIDRIQLQYSEVTLEGLWECTSMTPAQAVSLLNGYIRVLPQALFHVGEGLQENNDDSGGQWEEVHRHKSHAPPSVLDFWLNQKYYEDKFARSLQDQRDRIVAVAAAAKSQNQGWAAATHKNRFDVYSSDASRSQLSRNSQSPVVSTEEKHRKADFTSAKVPLTAITMPGTKHEEVKNVEEEEWEDDEAAEEKAARSVQDEELPDSQPQRNPVALLDWLAGLQPFAKLLSAGWTEPQQLLKQVQSNYKTFRPFHFGTNLKPKGYTKPTPGTLGTSDVWKLSETQRGHLLWYWLRERRSRYKVELETANEEFSQLNSQLQELQQLQERDVFRAARVVAMTTTGAAMKSDLIRFLKPKIVFVEEAAEILEAHILAALSPSVQHVVLIGDHQQLRPSPAHHELATKYKMDVSLLQRLIDAGVEHKVLATNRRMRPSIAKLSSLHYRVEIKNAPCVEAYPEIKGVPSPVFLLNHQHPEDFDTQSQSHSNKHEALLALHMAKYLLQQGYSAKEITILTTYSGQLRLLNSLAKQLFPSDPNFHGKNCVLRRVVDKYQGEENRVVLLSLVRSTLEKQGSLKSRNPLGFLNVDNRMCVALSRAKEGLYVFGNFDMMQEYSDTWSKICGRALESGHLGTSLKLKCAVHGTGSEVQAGKDFQQVPEGGCSVPCAVRMPCGHTCPRLCHPDDREHKETRCMRPCAKVKPFSDCDHRCPLLCHQDCGDCQTVVEKTMPACLHLQKIRCSLSPAHHSCTEKVSKLFPVCQHPDEHFCGERLAQMRLGRFGQCAQRCDAVLECGDKCPLKCHVGDSPLRHGPCSKNCLRKLVCGHNCAQAHPCNSVCPPCQHPCQTSCQLSKCLHPCKIPCRPCTEACSWACEHLRCTRQCSQPCDRKPCDKPCRKKLSCEHFCLGVCGEACPKLCRICQPTAQVYSETLMDEELKECLKDKPLARFISLECGHTFDVTALDRYVNSQFAATSQGAAIQALRCPVCRKAILRTRGGPARYGTQINMLWADMEGIKRKLREQLRKQKLQKLEAAAKEAKQIVSAMGSAAGHWFKCAEGHPYYIGECGGAMEESTCPECKGAIGGRQHSLTAGNSLASEMDGATTSAWPGMASTSEQRSIKPLIDREFIARVKELREAREHEDTHAKMTSDPEPTTLTSTDNVLNQESVDLHTAPGLNASPAEIIAYQDREYELALRQDMAAAARAHAAQKGDASKSNLSPNAESALESKRNSERTARDEQRRKAMQTLETKLRTGSSATVSAASSAYERCMQPEDEEQQEVDEEQESSEEGGDEQQVSA
eukprot:gb/GEZN01000155.1/.p1 GENE.gb/GEZN01000155.1/~~gb/GEZN01000155.1/.p1  ORF type:complete len:2053 (-),score=236.01 gb/GEZN01000155.1/:129-6287(-)